MLDFDVQFFRAVNGFAGGNSGLDAAGIFVATYLIFGIALAVLLPLWYRRKNHRAHVGAAVTAMRAAMASLLGIFGNVLFGLLLFRPRPFVTLPDVTKLVDIMPTVKSFPSDHATIAFAIAVSVFLRDRRFGAVLLAAAALVAFGRVFVGVHYPSDVLAGAVVGAVWAMVIKELGPRFGEVERMERLLLGRRK